MTEKYTEATIHQVIYFEQILCFAKLFDEEEQAKRDYQKAVTGFTKLNDIFTK